MFCAIFFCLRRCLGSKPLKWVDDSKSYTIENSMHCNTTFYILLANKPNFIDWSMQNASYFSCMFRVALSVAFFTFIGCNDFSNSSTTDKMLTRPAAHKCFFSSSVVITFRQWGESASELEQLQTDYKKSDDRKRVDLIADMRCADHKSRSDNVTIFEPAINVWRGIALILSDLIHLWKYLIS